MFLYRVCYFVLRLCFWRCVGDLVLRLYSYAALMFLRWVYYYALRRYFVVGLLFCVAFMMLFLVGVFASR